MSFDSNCRNCAAPLNWHLEACEYCDTFFVPVNKGFHPEAAYKFQLAQMRHAANVNMGRHLMLYDPRYINPKDIGSPRSTIPINYKSMANRPINQILASYGTSQKQSKWDGMLNGIAQAGAALLR